ncbi:hypothetical protein [Marinifilum flexuosum]|uniref:Uncharacterized protein n=1 Tax=Marinifilum flexuosum TaxID=1117708 RepID=A0A419X3A2_9BACT|nr:hypothetical protein [Marinifilum flexuosum]RKE02246.1 hypothetical protein BXY64_2334 [Marinifilum flexuosum]
MSWKNKLKIVFIGGGLLTLLILNLVMEPMEPYEKYFESHFSLGRTKFDVYGIVEDKYVDSVFRLNPTFVLKDSNDDLYKFYFHSNDYEFYDFIEIGDTIISEKNSIKAEVRNNEKNRLFNFPIYR